MRDPKIEFFLVLVYISVILPPLRRAWVQESCFDICTRVYVFFSDVFPAVTVLYAVQTCVCDLIERMFFHIAVQLQHF